jgi:hypothetical protein
MRKISDILLTFWLTVLAAVMIGSAFVPAHQMDTGVAEGEITSAPVEQDVLYATPFPALLLSEILIDNDSEIEPKESGYATLSFTIERTLGANTYLKKSKLILVSLSVWDLIFPFHTHL